MNLTKAQRTAIGWRGGNLLLSASAGSGKTEVLARRCVALISDPASPCGVEQLLVATFTRAAAAELRVRIARMLRQASRETADAAMRRHLRRQELMVDAADIGTIDAWCQRVLRENFATAGVDPGFAILSEVEAPLLRAEVLERLMRWVYAADEPAAEAVRDWLRSAARPGDRWLQGMVLELNHFRERLADDAAWFAEQARYWSQDAETLRASAQARLGAALAGECAFQRARLGPLIEQGRGGLRVALDRYAACLRRWEQRAGQAGGLLGVVDELAETTPKAAVPDAAEAPALAQSVRRWYEKRLRDRWEPHEIAPIFEHVEAVAQRMRTLLDLEARYQQELTAVKRQRGVMEFGDVLRHTLALLRPGGQQGGDTPLARQLRQRYAHILVDEYQDTSPLQVELLRALTREPPAPGNRFMVGDIKQSIYGFRDAEPRLFNEQRDRLRSGAEPGCVLPLQDNFRSHARLVAGVNRLFEMLFSEQLGGAEYDQDARLEARRTEIPNPTLDDAPRVAVRIVTERPSDAAAPGARLEETIEREARVIAATIHELLAAGTQVPHRRPDGGLELRPLRLADIVVLLRAAKVQAGQVAGVLREAGVACVASGRESVLDSREVDDVRSVLRLIVNRRNDVAMAAYLRGPMVGLSAAELLRLRRDAPKRSYSTAARLYAQQAGDELARRVRAALARIDAWRAMARDTELPALLRHIVRDSALGLFARGLPGGTHRTAVLESLIGLAESLCQREQAGVAEFVEHLDALAADDLAPMAGLATSEDVVRIMTIHAAKGLEFPIVFLAGTAANMQGRTSEGALVCHRDEGVGIKMFDARRRAFLTSANHPIATRFAAHADIEEELRLLYVAATRAREKLYVLGVAPEDAAARHAAWAGGSPPPLITRLVASRVLDWLLMAAAASGADQPRDDGPSWVDVSVVDPDEMQQAGGTSARVASGPEPLPPPDDGDRAWVAAARELMSAPLERAAAQRPAVFSVSVLKSAVRRAADGGRGDWREAVLAPPRFAQQADRRDGRVVGAATHRFMEWADLAALRTPAAVRAQIEALRAAGRLDAQEAALVDAGAIAWLMQTELGRRIAEGDGVRRETAFVYSLAVGDERLILRGVIDCLVPGPDGLTLIDYKTDALADDSALRERLEIYSRQLQLYALAARDLFETRIAGGWLALLEPRRLEAVDVSSATLDALARDWWSGLPGFEMPADLTG